MAQPYIGEIRLFAGNYEPNGWKFCDGQVLPILGNETLFQLIGTTYGGDGTSDFALPDLRGRLPVHQGNGPGGTTFQIGQAAGTEEVTLTVQQIPAHTHQFLGAGVSGNQTPAQGALPANSLNATPYINFSPDTNMKADSVTPVGGSQPHTNMQPFTGINFIISMSGIFPSPT
jgi:microcystin-dependent protein